MRLAVNDSTLTVRLPRIERESARQVANAYGVPLSEGLRTRRPSRPHRGVVVRDSRVDDIEPAVELGLRTVWILRRPRLRVERMTSLEVIEVEPFGPEELLAALRRTRLHGFDGAQLYENARLELATCDPEVLAPPQRYVLTERVQKILELRSALLDHGVDPFGLQGGVWIRTSEAPRVPVIPPVVEESPERDGRTALIISDGMHRVFAARSVGLPITVVVARGVPAQYPYYAYALDDGWSGVVELAELPDVFQKKEYRVPNGYRALFRLYDDVFPGVQERRKQTNPGNLSE